MQDGEVGADAVDEKADGDGESAFWVMMMIMMMMMMLSAQLTVLEQVCDGSCDLLHPAGLLPAGGPGGAIQDILAREGPQDSL